MGKTITAKEMTPEEARDRFLASVADAVQYWLNEQRRPSAKEKLEGLAFSILVMIDGGHGSLPSFKLIPNPHPTDKSYCQENGEDWWPNNCDIGGGLHELIHQKYKN